MEKREDKVYVCNVCGNEVKFVKDGGGALVCCGEKMSEKKE
jgi:desulfoferrodoxin-like iron-binding protein